MQVLYSQYPYLMGGPPSPTTRQLTQPPFREAACPYAAGTWPWGADGEGWRVMSASFRAWTAMYPADVFAALGCCELHLWMDLHQPWKVVIPQDPSLPLRIEA